MIEVPAPVSLMEKFQNEDALLSHIQKRADGLRGEIGMVKTKLHYPGEKKLHDSSYSGWIEYLRDSQDFHFKSVWTRIIGRLRQETHFLELLDNLGIRVEDVDLSKSAKSLGAHAVDSSRWGKGIFKWDEPWDADGVVSGSSVKFQDDITKKLKGDHKKDLIDYIWDLATKGYINETSVLAHELMHERHFNSDGELRPLQWTPLDNMMLRLIVYHGLRKLKTRLPDDFPAPRNFNRELYEAFAFVAVGDKRNYLQSEGKLLVKLTNEKSGYGFNYQKAKAALLSMMQLKALNFFAVSEEIIMPDDPLYDFQKSTASLIYDWVSAGSKFDAASHKFPQIEERIDQYCRLIGINRNSAKGKQIVARLVSLDRLSKNLQILKAEAITQEEMDREFDKVLVEPRIQIRCGVPPFFWEIFPGERFSSESTPYVFFPADGDHPYNTKEMVGYVFYEKEWPHQNPNRCLKVYFKLGQDGVMHLKIKEDVPESQWDAIFSMLGNQATNAVAAENSQEYGPDRQFSFGDTENSVLEIALSRKLAACPWQFRLELFIQGAGLEKYRDRLWGYVSEKNTGQNENLPIEKFLKSEEIEEIRKSLSSILAAKRKNISYHEVENLENLLGKEIASVYAKDR